MLTIVHSKSSDAALHYFRESLITSDYYTDRKTITGLWRGKLAEKLGLSGEIDEKDFRALLHNKTPEGQRLTARNMVNRRPMYDFTFSAPKSLSILYSIAGDNQVLAAHREGVARAMAEVEAHILVQKGTGKGKHYQKSGNGLYGEFVHEMARPVEVEMNGKTELVPDCQLHSHCTLINATYDESSDSYRAVELSQIKALAPYFEALYHSHLGAEMRRLGYELQKEGKRWEIKGITKEIRDKYSGRTIKIEKEFKERGLKSAMQKAVLGSFTRNQKGESSLSQQEIYQNWRDRLSLSEYHAIMNARTGSSGSQKEAGKDHYSPERAIDMAFEHYFERVSGIEEKKILAYAIDLTSGMVHPVEIKKELARRDNIIATEVNTEKHITTKEMLAEEVEMIKHASNGRNSCVPLNPDYTISDERLIEGQRAAIDHVLNSKDQTILVSGDAGVGKTRLFLSVKAAVEQAEKHMLSVASSAKSSRGELQSKGFEGAETIAKLLQDRELQNSIKDGVLHVDEAGMIGVPTMRQLQELTSAQNARLILSGDYKQHNAVQRGDAQRIIQQQSKLPVAQVTQIMRQKDRSYKEIVEGLASGIGKAENPQERKQDVAKAFDKLDQNGAVVEIEDKEARHEQIAKQYVASTQKSTNNTIVVTPTHHEGKEVTEAIRHKLKDTGRLDQKDNTFERLQALHLTETEKQVPTNFVPGQTVEFVRSTKGGFMAGMRFEVKEHDEHGNVLVQGGKLEKPSPLPLDAHERFSLYDKQTIELAKQDRIRITKNIKSMDGVKLFNGQEYSVDGFTKDGHIKLSNGQVLSKNSMHYTHGYYSTSIGAQGSDKRNVLVAQSSASVGAASDKQFYVSISRGQERCIVYTDDKEYLRESITKSGDRKSAIEIDQEARKQKKMKQLEHQKMVSKHQEQRSPTKQPAKQKPYEPGTQKPGYEPGHW